MNEVKKIKFMNDTISYEMRMNNRRLENIEKRVRIIMNEIKEIAESGKLHEVIYLDSKVNTLKEYKIEKESLLDQNKMLEYMLKEINKEEE